MVSGKTGHRYFLPRGRGQRRYADRRTPGTRTKDGESWPKLIAWRRAWELQKKQG